LTRIAVTGAAGYIGSQVTYKLRTEHPDWELIPLDSFYHGDVQEIGDLSVEHIDVRDRDRLETALEGTDVVLHLAAVSGVDNCADNPDFAYEVNVSGTNNVAWFCRKTGAALVFPYSMAVLGDPTSFPITVDMEGDPLNWYGRTKVLNKQAIEIMAEDEFPAHLFMISNLYGSHKVDGRVVSKGTVINIFVSRGLAGEPLTVYEPGTQARNFIHVKDVARAFLRSTERLVDQQRTGETGAKRYEVASDEDPDVMTVAETVKRIAQEERGLELEVELVENPRAGETLVDEFGVDTARVREDLNWEPRESVEGTIQEHLRE